jgi:hypothetical protein
MSTKDGIRLMILARMICDVMGLTPIRNVQRKVRRFTNRIRCRPLIGGGHGRRQKQKSHCGYGGAQTHLVLINK